MYHVLTGVGAVCFLYLLILLAKGVDFAIIWLPVSLLFLAAGGYGRYCLRHPQGFRIPAPLLTAAGVLLALALALFLVVEGLILREMLTKPQAGLDVLIVLGAQVKGKEPSRALLRRLEAAERYLQENPDTVAVLSGGMGEGEEITEAECMYRYLTGRGIDGARLILEDRSTSTAENLTFSARKIAEHFGKSGGMSQKTGLLSNNFHVYRARLLAEKMGYTDVHSIPAASDWRLQVHYLVREFFALCKEKATGKI